MASDAVPLFALLGEFATMAAVTDFAVYVVFPAVGSGLALRGAGLAAGWMLRRRAARR